MRKRQFFSSEFVNNEYDSNGTDGRASKGYPNTPSRADRRKQRKDKDFGEVYHQGTFKHKQNLHNQQWEQRLEPMEENIMQILMERMLIGSLAMEYVEEE